MGKNYAPIKTGSVSKAMSNMIHQLVMSDNFSWFWNDFQIGDQFGAQYSGFTHVFYKFKINSEYFPQAHELVREIIKNENLQVNQLVRVQANLLTNIHANEIEISNSIHVDMDNPGFKSIVYYVDDSDGDTIIFGDQDCKVSPVKGTYVMFDSHTKHMASIPKKHKRRVVFNIILGIKK